MPGGNLDCECPRAVAGPGTLVDRHARPLSPAAMIPILRLLADDLTGALDTAAALTGLCGPIAVPLIETARPAGSLALDTATREASRDEAMARVARQAGLLADGDIAFKKVDSLMRGHVAAELAACLRAGPWRHCILAPAFPEQRRITRGGRQYAAGPDGAWRPVGAHDLLAMLATDGVTARPGRLDAALPEGVSVFDADSTATLDRIAALGQAVAAPLLWCGTAGLARALAGTRQVGLDPGLTLPVLGVFGSDQPIQAQQLAACGGVALRLPGAQPAAAARIARLMAGAGAAMISLDLPANLGRPAAAAAIAATYAALLPQLPRPGTLIIAGGETLRGVCTALGAEAILATGLVMQGVPRARLQGGRWDGLGLVTKSGAFGAASLWRDLLASSGVAADRAGLG
jgi:uncharacterized protein YgbK (DUF1537 family)